MYSILLWAPAVLRSQLIINNRRTAGTELNEKYYNIATERVTEALTGRLKVRMINLFIPHQPDLINNQSILEMIDNRNRLLSIADFMFI